MTPIALWCPPCTAAAFQPLEGTALETPGHCQKCGASGKLHRVEPPQCREETHA